jgi:hypothetical protein
VNAVTPRMKAALALLGTDWSPKPDTVLWSTIWALDRHGLVEADMQKGNWVFRLKGAA